MTYIQPRFDIADKNALDITQDARREGTTENSRMGHHIYNY